MLILFIVDLKGGVATPPTLDPPLQRYNAHTCFSATVVVKPEIIYRGIGNGINQHELTRAILERTIKGTNPYYSTTDEIIKLTKEFS